MSHFSAETMIGLANPHCVACSKNVIEAYQKDSVALMRLLSHQPDALQTLTGLDDILDNVRGLTLDDFDD